MEELEEVVGSNDVGHDTRVVAEEEGPEKGHGLANQCDEMRTSTVNAPNSGKDRKANVVCLSHDQRRYEDLLWQGLSCEMTFTRDAIPCVKKK